jgi:hypothetical protein
MRVGVVRSGSRELIAQRKRLAICGKRIRALARGHQRVTKATVSNVQVILPKRILRIDLNQRLRYAHGSFSRIERGLGIALGKIGHHQLADCDFFGALELGTRFAGLRELILQRTRAVENPSHQMQRHAGFIPKVLRQFEHHVVRGPCRGGERLLGAIALLLRDLLLLGCRAFIGDREFLVLERDPPLPAGDHDQHRERRHARVGERERAPLLAQLLRKQVLFRDAADGRSEIGAGLDKFAVARAGGLAISAQVHPFGLARKPSCERGRNRQRRGRDKRTPLLVLGKLAFGEPDEQRRRRIMIEPVGDFLIDHLEAAASGEASRTK